MKLNRTQAMALRKKLMNAVKSEFKPEPATFYTNVFTHSNILWQSWMYDKKFCGFDVSIRSPLKPPVEEGLFTQHTESVIDHSKAACDLLANVVKRELSIKTFEFVEGPLKPHRPEKFMRAVDPQTDIEVRYYTHNDSNGWGRPEVIVTIPFE